MNAVFTDIETALTNAFCKDGQSTMTGDMKAGGYKLIGLGDGTKTAPSVAFSASTTTGIYSSGVGKLAISAADTKVVEVTSTGAAVTGTLSATGNITTGVTASRAVVTNSSNVLAASAVTSTELGYLSGVTSSVQTQLDSKQGTTVTGAASTIMSSNLTANKVLISDGNGKVAASLVGSVELVAQTTSSYTPTVKFGSSVATGTFAGLYCRTGKLVNVSISLEFSALGSGASGDALNLTLPFTSANSYPYYGAIGWMSGVDSSVSALTLALDGGSSTLYVAVTASGTSAYATKAKFTDSAAIHGSIVYLTDD
jgi:hypothetical protein